MPNLGSQSASTPSPTAQGPASFGMLALMTAMVAIGPVSTDLYLPSLPSIGGALAADASTVQLTLGVFMGGFAAGTLVYGPISDRFGRRPTMLSGLVLFAAASLCCALADTIGQLIAWRLVQGIAGAAAPIVSRAVVRDLYQREEAARIMSYMAGAMALAPSLAPVIGGWIHVAAGWHGHFWALTGGGLVLMLMAWRIIFETNRHPDPRALSAARLGRNISHLYRHPTFTGFALTNGFSYGGLFSFISSGSFVLISGLGVAPQNFGFLFMCVAGSFVVGGLAGGRLSRRLGVVRLIGIGVLVGMAGGAAGLALAIAGVTSVAAVIVPAAAVFFAFALVSPSSTAGAVAPFPDMAGTAASASGFTQMAIGAAIGTLAGALYDGTARPMFAVILATTTMGAVAFYAKVRPHEARDPR